MSMGLGAMGLVGGQLGGRGNFGKNLGDNDTLNKIRENV